MLSADEHSLITLLEDRILGLEYRIPGLEAEVAWEVCGGGATLSLSKVASSDHASLQAKARRVIAAILSPPVPTLFRLGLSAPLVHPPSHQVAAPAAYVTIVQQVITRYLGEEDAYATSGIHNKMPKAYGTWVRENCQGKMNLCPSPHLLQAKNPLALALLLKIAKEVINSLTMAQEKRMLSTNEHSLIKFLEDRIPGLEAEVALEVSGGEETLFPSKVAFSGHACLQAKVRSIISGILSWPVTTLFHPGLSTLLVHPLSHQVAAPAAYVTVDQHVVTGFSGEEDGYATSGVHNKMPDASVSHDHGRGQEFSSEHEFFSEKCNSGCNLGIVTEKSSTTIALEIAPPPSDGDSTAESSGVSNRWGTAPEAKDFDDLGFLDDLGLYRDSKQ
jgi:hypothetical protein